MIIPTSRMALDVRGTKTNPKHPLAGHLEVGFSEPEEKSEGTSGSPVRIPRLTRREQQIVNLLLEGCANVEIAGQLRIAQRTVKACFNRLFLRFGITSGIKRVKLATLVYRSQLCPKVIFTGNDAQLNGNTPSSLSSPWGSRIGTSLEELELRNTSSRTVFEPSTTSWECGTASSSPCGTRQEATMTGLPHLDARGRGILPLGRMILAKRRGLRRNLDGPDQSI